MQNKIETAKHTPGPWQFYADVPSTDPNWHIVTNASRLRVVANVHIEPGNEMDQANARLIAAAPELLEALQNICECDAGSTLREDRNELCKRVEKARAAIKKAGQQ